MDQLCLREDIFHHTIRPRTPRHNGKVERSHRNDNETFYNFLTFYSLGGLRKQGKQYFKRSNNIHLVVLKYKTPIVKRNELILVLLAKYIPFTSLVNAK